MVLLYAPVTRYQFLNFDDDVYVTTNPHVVTGITAENLRWAFTSAKLGGLWHPLTWISHMVDASMFGLNPAGHHGNWPSRGKPIDTRNSTRERSGLHRFNAAV